jgi:Cof subfamily protein (haloacid dehalogenase superfamily)
MTAGPPPGISLVVADVDGTLITDDKVLTPRALAAVESLHDAQIRFAITSGRPPRGMAMLIDVLKLDTPIAAFNGGLFVTTDFSIVEQHTLPSDVAREALELLHVHGLDAWVYRDNDWLVTDLGAPHVAREAWTVKFQPTQVRDFANDLARVAKIVGVSDEHDRVQRCESDARAAFGTRATAARSQPYYLDVTSKDANKGAVVAYLSRAVGVPTSRIATIGDQPSDVLMFERSGFSIAMGNASDQVKSRADATTDSCNDDGFAKAIERFIIGPRTRDAEAAPWTV